MASRELGPTDIPGQIPQGDMAQVTMSTKVPMVGVDATAISPAVKQLLEELKDQPPQRGKKVPSHRGGMRRSLWQ